MKRTYFLLILITLTCFTTFSKSTATSWGDYTLYAPQGGTKGYLVDNTGTTYHTWTFASNKRTAYSTYMLRGGTLVRTVQYSNPMGNGGGMTGEVQKVDWNGNVTWDYVYSTTGYCLHHDICPMPNGNVLMISYEVKTTAEATQAGCLRNITIWSEKIIEVQPTGASTGTIVWEWHLWDHLCQDYNSAKNNYVTSIAQHPELININCNTAQDWIHMNGIDYNEALDQVVFSSHAQNELYVIDHSTTTAQAATHSGGNSGKGGDFLYRWGNPSNYGATGTKIFNVVHDAHWIPADCPKANYISAFNNKGGTGNKTCIDVFNPPYNGYNYSITTGSAYLPSTYSWRHTYSGSATQDLGNAQQLPNGNTLICIAQSGYIYEIDSNQAVVWSKSTGGVVPQAYRYTACYTSGTDPTVDASADVSSVCAGKTVQLNVAPSGGSGYTYSWTSLPSGFTSTDQNPSVTPTSTTVYVVKVTSGGCTATSSVTVKVNPLPLAPTITQSGNSLNSNYSSGNQWYGDGVVISGANSQSYLPTKNGFYQVQYTDSNNCTSPLSDTFDYQVTGTSESNPENNFSVYPNPATGRLKINGISELNNLEILVFDIYGKQLKSVKNADNIDVSLLENGIYCIVLREEGKVVYKSKFSVLK